MIKHKESGQDRTAEYTTWKSIRQRCARHKNYVGLTVSPIWDDYERFLFDMGRRPSPLHSIDRIDNNKGYEPGNCRWATIKEQQNNRKSNIKIEINRDCKTLTEWANYFGVVSPDTAMKRVSTGWRPDKAVSTPTMTPSRAGKVARARQLGKISPGELLEPPK